MRERVRARAKRWTERRCEHGQVVYRIQIDVAHCDNELCADRRMASLGWYPKSYREALESIMDSITVQRDTLLLIDTIQAIADHTLNPPHKYVGDGKPEPSCINCGREYNDPLHHVDKET